MNTKVNKDRLILNGHTYANHLFIEALTNTLKGDEFGRFLNDIDWKNKDEIECYFVVEGQRVPFMEVCEEWQKQADGMIDKRAFELVEEQFSGLQDALNNIKVNVLHDVAERLGVEVDLYDYL